MSADALRVDGRAIVKDNIFNSNGVHVGSVSGSTIFDLKGNERYTLKGSKIYRLTGELIGHLNNVRESEIRLDRANDRLFV
jgi:sporulation protein YlmC with PRC-barrel domain